MRWMHVVAVAAVLSWAASARAQSAATCAFDPASATLTVSVDGAVARLLADKATGEIQLNGADCAGAAVTSTDTILVNGGALNDKVALTGVFAPGLTPEADGAGEIEIVFALGDGRDKVTVNLGGGNDRQILTSGGLDTGDDGDEDISTAGTEVLVIDAGAGNDVVDVSGYTGAPLRSQIDLYGGAGNDRLTGDAHTNHLYGEEGDDIIYGGDHRDFIEGGPGNDVMYGGRGSDGFIADATMDGSDVVRGGAGIDTVDYTRRSNALTVTLGNGLADDGEAGEADLVASDVEGVVGGSGDDLLVGSAGRDSLGGGAGNDEIHGGDGDDTVGGGDGDDRVFGDLGIDLVGGGAGDDYLDGGLGADRFWGDAGIDTVDYGSRTSPVTVTIGNWIADDGEAGEGDDLYFDIETVIGGSGNDSLTGGVYACTLLGGAGDDELRGSGGDDVLDGGEGNDHLASLAGADELYGDLGDDLLEGFGGADRLYGGDGNDTLDGGGGTDLYFGEAGDDTFRNTDGLAETIECGDGVDDAEPDPLDTFIGCEL